MKPSHREKQNVAFRVATGQQTRRQMAENFRKRQTDFKLQRILRQIHEEKINSNTPSTEGHSDQETVGAGTTTTTTDPTP